MCPKEMKSYLNEWHGFSTNRKNNQISGVTITDILNILKGIEKKFNLPNIIKFEQTLLEHRLDFNNPHEITIDQLDKVIDRLYAIWLDEGYNGTIEEFKTIIFQYYEYATDDDFNENPLNEDKVTSVLITTNALNRHNDALDDIHVDIFKSIFIGENIKYTPTFSIHTEDVFLNELEYTKINDNSSFIIPISDYFGRYLNIISFTLSNITNLSENKVLLQLYQSHSDIIDIIFTLKIDNGQIYFNDTLMDTYFLQDAMINNDNTYVNEKKYLVSIDSIKNTIKLYSYVNKNIYQHYEDIYISTAKNTDTLAYHLVTNTTKPYHTYSSIFLRDATIYPLDKYHEDKYTFLLK